MKKKSILDLTDFYYCAEQKIVSLVTSLFENPFRSEMIHSVKEWEGDDGFKRNDLDGIAGACKLEKSGK